MFDRFTFRAPDIRAWARGWPQRKTGAIREPWRLGAPASARSTRWILFGQLPPTRTAACCGLGFLIGLEFTGFAGAKAGLGAALLLAVAVFICARFLALKSRTILAMYARVSW